MTTRLTNSLKNQLFIYLVIAALAIATPEFAGRAEAQDDSGYYFILEGRFAFAEGDETPILESGLGRVIHIDTQDGGGGRIGGGYRFGDWDVGLFYSGLGTSDSIPSQHSCRTTGGTYCYSYDYFFPILGSAYNGGYSHVKSEASVTYHVVDFEAGYNLQLGEADVRLFAGIRFADFDQDVDTTFFEGSRRLEEKRDVDFWGAGIRLGASASANIMGSFGSTASVSGTVLFGEQDTLTTQNQTSGRTIIGDTRVSSSDDRTTWNVEGELGLTYTQELYASTLMFILGYRVESWYDVNNTQSEPPTNSGNIFGSMYADQIFHGPFLRGELRFK